MEKTIDEKKLAEAMEKLACHIEPPGHKTGGGGSGSDAGAACAAPDTGDDFIDQNGRVLLTRMTSAGG